MDYVIRNTQKTLDSDLLKKAKELANNKEKTATGSITEKEVSQLLQIAKSKDGVISEEEVRFIAGLTSEENIKKLNESGFSPINGEVSFSRVSKSKLNTIREKGEKLSNQSSIENSVKRDSTIRPFFDALNDPSISQSDRVKMMEDYKKQNSDNHFLRTLVKGKVFSKGSMSFLWSKVSPTGGTSTAPKTNHDKRMNQPGLYPLLYEASKEQPMMNIVMMLAKDLKAGKVDNPQKLLEQAVHVSQAAGSSDPHQDALKSIAIIMSGVHGALKDNAYASPEHKKMLEFAKEAYIEINQKKSTNVVLGHGISPMQSEDSKLDYNSDNNLHFWSHAFIAYTMLNESGTPDKNMISAAKAFSATVGTEYEIINIGEHRGNSGIKDIIINRYGAEFGIQYFFNKNTKLPQNQEGPQVENKRDF